MMKIVTNFKQWLFSKYNQQKSKAIEQAGRRLRNESCKSFQLMEFYGRVYVSHQGVPVVRVDDLKSPAPKILEQSRKDYIAWKAKFQERHG